jgi:hypothetical protein
MGNIPLPEGLSGIVLQSDRRFRHLYDLRGRTFVEADFPGDDSAVCYGCSCPFLVGRSTGRRAFVTTAANEVTTGLVLRMRTSDKQVFWICRTCFEEFAAQLRLEVNASLTLDKVLARSPLGPAIGS